MDYLALELPPEAASIRSPGLRRAAVAAGFILFLAVWYADFVTGPEINLAPFYLLPIALVTWGRGLRWGWLMSLLSASAWLHSNVYPVLAGPGQANWPLELWNTSMKLCFFAMLPLLIRIFELRGVERRARRISEESSRLKSRMVALVAHEFANVLTNLQTASALLKDSDPSPESESRGYSYGVLERTLRHLSMTINNLLDLARMESGRLGLRAEPVPVAALVRETLEIMNPLIRSRNLRVRFEAHVSEDGAVRADRHALRLILDNILSNAVKFTLPDGTITIGFDLEAGAPGRMRISIQDTGIGVSAEDQRKIMEGFYRAGPGKDLAGGFGIGLKTTMDLLENMGSRLELESESGRGSRFYFRLPLWNDGAGG